MSQFYWMVTGEGTPIDADTTHQFRFTYKTTSRDQSLAIDQFRETLSDLGYESTGTPEAELVSERT